MQTPLLEIKDLSVMYRGDEEEKAALQNISLSVYQNEIVGIIGESGSGKSTLVQTVLGILPYRGGIIRSGAIFYNGLPIVSAQRGRDITFIPQDPSSAFDPFFSIGAHFAECARGEHTHAQTAAVNRIITTVGLSPVAINMNSYPHQLSGGMKQRLLVALALVPQPKIIIADEPTSNLDVLSAEGISALFRTITATEKISLLLTTHDLAFARSVCDRIHVMYQGMIVESGTPRDLFAAPQHAYTRALIAE